MERPAGQVDDYRHQQRNPQQLPAFYIAQPGPDCLQHRTRGPPLLAAAGRPHEHRRYAAGKVEQGNDRISPFRPEILIQQPAQQRPQDGRKILRHTGQGGPIADFIRRQGVANQCLGRGHLENPHQAGAEGNGKKMPDFQPPGQQQGQHQQTQAGHHQFNAGQKAMPRQPVGNGPGKES